MISHIAFTMDGNRRWARRQGLPVFLGHREGAKRIEFVVKYCLDHKIKYVSLYTFSIENFKRSLEEKSYLFSLINEIAKNKLPLFLQHGIKVNVVGDRSLFPEHVRETCSMLEQETAGQTRLVLTFLFCYGGQQEIVAATKRCIDLVVAGTLQRDDVTVALFSQQLWSGQVPPPDIIVRTGGVQRLSNCLLFHAAYSEFCFTETLWPDFNEQELDAMLERYQLVKRNFGV
jgi:undecaprenyl diphosphate synthase